MSEGRKIMQVRSARQVPVRVKLLDDDVMDDTVDKRAVGGILFDKVCAHLNILEKDYFGLNFVNPEGVRYWLDNEKKIAKQMKGLQAWNLCFEVKFYPSDPLQMVEDLTRYQLCLQIRRDIVNEKLPCSTVTYALLGSFTAQAELGDYEVEEFGSGTSYLKEIQFAPHQDRDLLSQIAKLHRSHKGLTPEDAELKFLEKALILAMYGVEFHPAKDAEGKDISLGVCASGILVYKDKQQVNRFVWPKILKMSYRRNKFYIKIRPGEFENFASLIGFRTISVKMAKRLWKICVEHHSFFRFKEPEPVKNFSVIPRFGSRFRYSGRTQYQSRQLCADEARDSPYFDRVLSKRGTFGGRTQNMRQRDEDRKRQRDEMRRAPPPLIQDSKQHVELPPEEKGSLPEPKRTPPEPRHAPPVAPKPKPHVAPKPKKTPRGPPSVDDNASLDRGSRGSLNDSFEDIPDRRSKMEKMHAVMTPLAAVMQKSLEQKKHPEDSEEEDKRPEHDHPDDDDEDELDVRPITPEMIDQDEAPEPQPTMPMSVRDRKLLEKQEKERIKKEKEMEKMRKKEEEKEKKRLEKEKKALLAAEKKAAKQKSKQKGKDNKRDSERRDSKSSNDMGRDWEQAQAHEHPGSVTPDRTVKRLSSFEEKDKNMDENSDDRPPTPPKPLEGELKGRKRERGRRGMKEAKQSEGSDYVTDEDDHEGPRRGRDLYDDEEEEVSF